MSEKQKKQSVAVWVIDLRRKMVLLGKRKNTLGEGLWASPGGHIDGDESVGVAAAREMLEEIGVEVKVEAFLPDMMTVDDFPSVVYDNHFCVWVYDGQDVRNMEPDKCEVWKWFDWDHLPVNMMDSSLEYHRKGGNPFEITNDHYPQQWQELFDLEGLIGGDIECLEPTGTTRGNIKRVIYKDGRVFFHLNWAAIKALRDEEWENLLKDQHIIDVCIAPCRHGSAYMISVSRVRNFFIYPKGSAKCLDPRDVIGLYPEKYAEKA